MRRFSLKTFLLLVMLCGALLALDLVQFRYRKLETEVVRLRKEVGHLGPIDPNRFNIVQVPTPTEPLVWKWRIRAPLGKRCEWFIQFNGIPEEGLPDFDLGCSSRAQFASTEDGELLTVALVENPDGRYAISFTGTELSARCGGQPLEILDGPGETNTAGAEGTQSFKADEPIVLIRRRVMEPTGVNSFSLPQGEARGFMIWLVPLP